MRVQYNSNVSHDTPFFSESDKAIYDEVKQQANLEYELINIHKLVPTENVVYGNVSM